MLSKIKQFLPLTLGIERPPVPQKGNLDLNIQLPFEIILLRKYSCSEPEIRMLLPFPLGIDSPLFPPRRRNLNLNIQLRFEIILLVKYSCSEPEIRMLLPFPLGRGFSRVIAYLK